MLESGDYGGAAEIWEALLEQTPESQDTGSGREAMICNALDARIEADGRQINANGEKEPLHLVEGQIALRRYLRAHAAAYGESKAVSAPVLERATTLAVAMADAQPQRVPAPVLDAYDAKEASPDPRPAPAPLPRNGIGLLVGGIGLGVLGLAVGLTMIPLGAALGRNAENIYTVATLNAAGTTSEPQRTLYLADAAEARRAGRTSNRVAIAGGVLSPLMLGGAAVMIARLRGPLFIGRNFSEAREPRWRSPLRKPVRRPWPHGGRPRRSLRWKHRWESRTHPDRNGRCVRLDGVRVTRGAQLESGR